MTALSGTISLVGAGPGDPRLITVRGLELLRSADVVVHDRLAGSELLDEVRPGAEVVDAGKSRGDHTLTQAQIDELIVARARAGLSVVRLKGGDPFVFGRGAEEVTAARRAGVACEVVPGVSSAIAGPAAAGIPVTARGVARTFGVATPETGAGPGLSETDYAALAGLDTSVFLMGVGELDAIARGLIGAGRDPGTPAAVVERATTPEQRQIVGTLGDIAWRARNAGIEPPAVVVVGAAAAFAQTGAAGPLAGRRVLVTRPRTASGDLSRRLRALGAEVIDAPLIRISPLDPPQGSFDDTIWDWVVFTSLHGVRAFWRALRAAGRDARWLYGARVAAVGPKTAGELRRVGIEPDLVPDEFRASALAPAILRAAGGRTPRVLFPCGTLARRELPEALRAGGASVVELEVYATEGLDIDDRARRRAQRGLDAVLLYSPSAAASLARSGLGIDGVYLACVGPTTATAAEALGLRVSVVPADYGDDGMVRALLERFSPHGAAR